VLLPPSRSRCLGVSEVEARWDLFKDNYDYQPKSVELIFNVLRTRSTLNRRGTDLDHHLSELVDSENLDQITREYYRLLEAGTSDRVRFLFTTPDVFRYEELAQVFRISDNEIRSGYNNILTIQSEKEYWITDQFNKQAEVDRSGARLNLDESSAHYRLYPFCKHFLELPPVAQAASFSRLLMIDDSRPELVVYSISYAPANAEPDSRILFVGFNPNEPLTDIVFMAFLDNSDASQSTGVRYMYTDWEEVADGIRRPRHISVTDFEVEHTAQEDFVDAMSEFPATAKAVIAARTLRFNVDIDEAEFEYSYPDSYAVFESAGGRIQAVLFDPHASGAQQRIQEAAENRAAQAQSRRLQRIDARVGGATFWGRAGIYMGVFGGICLVLAAFYYMRRIKG
jgi:hypothetical protein